MSAFAVTWYGENGDLIAEAVAQAQIVPVVIGPPGADGAGAATSEHVQSTPATQWTVNHNLGRRPAAVAVLTPGGVEVNAGVFHISVNQLIVEFGQPQTGTVRTV